MYFNPNTGTLFAVAKSFRIPHPTKSGKMLIYGVLEGPENAVYARGRLTGSNIIELPEYWSALVDVSTTTVQLTSIGKYQPLYVESFDDTQVVVRGADVIDCYYYIMAERKDIAKLIVEE